MESKYGENGFQWKRVKNQYYATFSVNLIWLCHGTISGWFAPVTPLLMSEDTPLVSGPLTLDEVSWLGSINCIGGIFAIFVFGFISSWIGCKRATTLLAIPAIIFWLTIIFGETFYLILFARFMSGWIGSGTRSTMVLYISEIANDNIRGQLVAASPLVRNVGLLMGYVIGAVVSYHTISYIFISIPIIFLITFVFLPNTPQYFLQKGNFDKAEKSLNYYKGDRNDDSECDKRVLKAEFERLQSIAEDRKGNEKVQLKDLYKREALTGFFMAIVFAFLPTITGAYFITTYSVTICDLSGMKMSPYVASIILAAVQTVGALCSIQLVDTLGRKRALFISLLGSSVGSLSLATYLYLDQQNYNLTHFNWVPVTSLAFILFMASVGAIPLANVCTVEHLSPKVRTVGMSVHAFGIDTFSFISAKFFPILIGVIEMHGCMMIFGIVSFLSIFFVYYAMEETSGKCLDTTDSKGSTKKANV